MRVLILHNPKAGDGRLPKADLVRAFETAGHTVRYRSLKHEHWRRSLVKRSDAIVVAGGDGAVAKVARALAKRGRSTVPLAVIPTGTANNIAHALGAAGTPRRIALGLESARSSHLAVGLARGPWGATRFVESAGIGLMASLLAADPPTARAGLAHLRRALETAASRPMKIRADNARIDGDYLMVQVMNINAIGPRLELAPNADPADDRLELLMIGPAELALFKRYLAARARGRSVRCPIPTRRVRRVAIASWPGDGGGGHVDDALWPDGRQGRGTRGSVRIRIEMRIPVLVL